MKLKTKSSLRARRSRPPSDGESGLSKNSRRDCSTVSQRRKPTPSTASFVIRLLRCACRGVIRPSEDGVGLGIGGLYMDFLMLKISSVTKGRTASRRIHFSEYFQDFVSLPGLVQRSGLTFRDLDYTISRSIAGQLRKLTAVRC
jgi:hypothetical protein